MSDIRKQWLDVVKKYRFNPDGPGSERYWCPELETAPRTKLVEIQNEKLEVLSRYVYEYSPFYRAKFDEAKLKPADIKSIEDLHKLPLTTKDEMAKDATKNPPWGTYLCIDDDIYHKNGWQMFATSGTTAAPRAFRHTLHDRDQWAWNDARGMWAMGIRPGDVAFIAFGYAPHVFFWGAHYAFNLMKIPIIPAGSLDTKKRADFINRFKPTILGATPSYLLYLGQVMKEMGYDPAASSIRIMLTGGEPGACIPSTKKRIETLWDAELHEFFGCTEASPTCGGYTCNETVKAKRAPICEHMMEDIQIWEVVDPVTYDPLPEGSRGLAVVTNLFSEAAPLMRFLVGDFTQFSTEPCACGRTHKLAVGGFAGRADDMIQVRGINVFPTTVEEVIRSIPELGDEFKIVVKGDYSKAEIIIVTEAKPDVPGSSYAALSNKLSDNLRIAIELRANVEVNPPNTLPKTEFKAKRVEDLRK